MKQQELFGGMSRDFVKDVMDLGVKKAYDQGASVFEEGDLTSHFFILLKGCVKLSIGENGHVVYNVSHAGEAFGWSSLIGREAYSASAKCAEPTRLIQFDRDMMKEVLEKYPKDEAAFFKRLARTLGNRLLQSYRLVGVHEEAISYGTGQVVEMKAA